MSTGRFRDTIRANSSDVGGLWRMGIGTCENVEEEEEDGFGTEARCIGRPASSRASIASESATSSRSELEMCTMGPYLRKKKLVEKKTNGERTALEYIKSIEKC